MPASYPWTWPTIQLPLGNNVDGVPVGVDSWRPDQPPATPDVTDDEMQGSVINPKWSIFDPGAVGTFSMDTDRRQMKIVNTGLNEKVCGVTQPVPVGTPYTLFSKQSIITSTIPTDNTWMGAGLMVQQAGAAATRDIRTIGINHIPGGIKGLYGSAYNWADYVNLTSFVDAPPAAIYSRIRVNGNNLWMDFGPDGQAWFNLYFEALPWTPAFMGLFNTVYGNTAGRTNESRFSFFRCMRGATAAFNEASIGRYVQGGA